MTFTEEKHLQLLARLMMRAHVRASCRTNPDPEPPDSAVLSARTIEDFPMFVLPTSAVKPSISSFNSSMAWKFLISTSITLVLRLEVDMLGSVSRVVVPFGAQRAGD